MSLAWPLFVWLQWLGWVSWLAGCLVHRPRYQQGPFSAHWMEEEYYREVEYVCMIGSLRRNLMLAPAQNAMINENRYITVTTTTSSTTSTWYLCEGSTGYSRHSSISASEVWAKENERKRQPK